MAEYKGVPVHERPLPWPFYGQYRGGNIYLRPGLSEAKKKLVLEHEWLHHAFYTQHPLLTSPLLVIYGLLMAPVAALGMPSFLFLLFLLPALACVANEGDILVRTRDPDALTWCKLGFLVAMLAVFAVVCELVQAGGWLLRC